MAKTDHSRDIDLIRKAAGEVDAFHPEETPRDRTGMFLAADLLELHDRQSLSLDTWKSARTFVQDLIGHPIQENHV